MSYKPFYIEAFKTGLERDKADFQLLPDAFSILQDAYIWRDRVARKKGYKKVGQLLRVLTGQSLGNTTASPFSGNIKTILSLETNDQIIPGTLSINIAAPGPEGYLEPAIPDGTLIGNGGGTGTINYTTGAFTLVSGAGWGAGQITNAAFYYAPLLPVMGISLRALTSINADQTVAFDTKYAYSWNSGNKRFEEFGGGTTWQGSDSQFFYVSNYYSASAGGDLMLVTNFNKGATPDPIRYYNGTWNTFAPSVDGIGNEIHQCRLIFPYKGRLIALNTWEGATLATSTQNSRRARWSQNGDAFATDAWRSDIAGRGGYIDAPTSEAIISAEFVRDTLIVGFEKSIWKLRYTSNQILPFVWERIDNEFGVESTFSIVRADTSQISIGSNGIVACDGINAKRIDEKIPSTVFNIHNENDGLFRVHGIRDFDKKLIYWTFPSSSRNKKFPDRILVFNYEDFSWSFFQDSLTCFGELQEFNDKAWKDYPSTTWAQASFTWVDTTLQSLYPAVIAGNHQGFIVKMQRRSVNDPALAITVITPGTPVQLTIPDHNLSTDQYIRVTGILGTASSLNDTSYKVNLIDANNITLSDADGIPITLAGGSTYLGNGEIILLHDYKVRTKKFNFLSSGTATEFGYIDFLTNKTNGGEFNVDIFADNNNNAPINVNDSFFNTTVSTAPYSSDIVGQDKLLHRMFARMNVQFLQFELNLTAEQKVDTAKHDADIDIFALTLWATGSGRLI